MMRILARTAAVMLSVLLAACASGPGFDTEGVDRDLAPSAAARDRVEDVPVLWGGTILATRPQEDVTELEILAYPLDGSQRPRTARASQGRFLANADGYLEPADYAPGRQVTVRGELTTSRLATVGEADYRYPVVTADHLHLWPRDETTRSSQPSIHFGIGIGILR